jgi:hypothetical protein
VKNFQGFSKNCTFIFIPYFQYERERNSNFGVLLRNELAKGRKWGERAGGGVKKFNFTQLGGGGLARNYKYNLGSTAKEGAVD